MRQGGEDQLDPVERGELQKIAGALLEREIRFVDLGADFRLADPASYEQWYGSAHAAPELLASFVCGIPEFHRKRFGTPGRSPRPVVIRPPRSWP